MVSIGAWIVSSEAQEIDHLLTPERLLYVKGHDRLMFSTFLGGGKVERVYGEEELEERVGVGFSFTWLHTYHFNKNWGIEWGLSYGGLPWRFYYETEPERGGLPYSSLNYHTFLNEYIALPLQAVFRTPIKPKLFLGIRSGVSIRYILLQELTGGGSSIQEDNSVIRVFDSESEFDNNFRTNFNLETGLSWLLPHHDMVEFQLIANISPRDFMKTRYYFFPGTEDETFGYYTSKGSYVGFSVGYTFTKIRKLYREYRKGKR